MYYAPYYYELALNGFSNLELSEFDDQPDGAYYSIFRLDQTDYKHFPELQDEPILALMESDYGFVRCFFLEGLYKDSQDEITEALGLE